MDVPSSPEALQEAARRFLRRFGLVAAAWSVLLGATAPTGADRPGLLVAGLAATVAWALVSQAVADPRAWWAGWAVVAVGLELLGPAAGTGGWSVAGGASFLVLTGAALAGRRRSVVATVVVLSVVALLRPAVGDGWSVAGSVGTVLLFCFGGVALAWLVRALLASQRERDVLVARATAAERESAVARERGEAAARLHDSVLQTLTAIGRADEPDEATRLARRAGAELRDFLRRAGDDDTGGSLGDRLRAAVTAAADGAPVSVSVVGDGPVDRAGEALVDAAAEAVRNAVRHGRPPVRVLLERGADDLAVWVADRGDGFDPDAVPADRLGVRRSVVGRVEAVGGSAALSVEDGCEWVLRVPLT